MKRRHFLGMSGASVLGAGFVPSCEKRGERLLKWDFITFHTPTSITLPKPAGYTEEQLYSLEKKCFRELLRLEGIFSLYDPHSSLSLLNRDATLPSPPPELLEALELSRRLYSQTAGIFDPTIQSYWQWLKQRHLSGSSPTDEERREALRFVNFSTVRFSKEMVTLLKGTQLTFNSFAQGLLTDRITELLLREGVENALVNIGEYRAIGTPSASHPQRAWLIKPDGPHTGSASPISLKNEALAVSSGSSHRLAATSDDHHILHAKSGASPEAQRTMAVVAQNAVLADALATICLLYSEKEAQNFVAKHYPAAKFLSYSTTSSGTPKPSPPLKR